MLAKCLSLKNIGEVALDKGDVYGCKSVPQGNTRMGKCCGVKDDKVDAFGSGFVYAFNEFVFGVALQDLQMMAFFYAERSKFAVNVFQSIAAINFRLAAAEQIQIGAVKYQNGRHNKENPGKYSEGGIVPFLCPPVYGWRLD